MSDESSKDKNKIQITRYLLPPVSFYLICPDYDNFYMYISILVSFSKHGKGRKAKQ